MLPDIFNEKMRRLLGEEAEAFFAAYERPRAVGLRVNPRQPAALPFALTPIPWEPTGFFVDPDARPGLHPFHEAGAYYLQEPSAMAPVALLDPQPGELVLDLCAAPGGKSTQIAARMQGQGLLLSNEIHPQRARILAGNLERMGAANAVVTNAHPAQLAERFPGCFDRVLVDAPCSGEGMFRKEEAAVRDWTPQAVEACARRQAEILDAACAMLQPGGRLVYSTCTFSPEEDEQTVAALLRRQPAFTLVQPDAPWGAPGRPDWADGEPALARCVRLWPHLVRGEGHFAAVFEKTEGERGDFSQENAVEAPEHLRAFCQENGLTLPSGTLLRFGKTLTLAPDDCPVLDGLRVLRAGLELGTLETGRFEPAHALALWCTGAARTLALDPDGPEVRQYLAGQTLPCALRGWTLVTMGGLSLGWGKGAGGVLKNHYPKGLRKTLPQGTVKNSLQIGIDMVK